MPKAPDPPHSSATMPHHTPPSPPVDIKAPVPANRASFTWSDARLLGMGAMDETHEEFYRVAQALLCCDAGSAIAAINRFEQHAIEHFEQEEEWMLSTNFPPRDCHAKEHASILQSTREVKEALADGRAGVELAHEYALFLFAWFPGHSDYLDSALAAWMTKHRYGGQPVVLRRRLQHT